MPVYCAVFLNSHNVQRTERPSSAVAHRRNVESMSKDDIDVFTASHAPCVCSPLCSYMVLRVRTEEANGIWASC